MAAHSFHVLFVCFSKILRYFTKILYINTSISKILAAGLERTTIRLYFRDFTLSAPPGLIMNLCFYLTVKVHITAATPNIPKTV